jgi:hypothetical protein
LDQQLIVEKKLGRVQKINIFFVVQFSFLETSTKYAMALKHKMRYLSVKQYWGKWVIVKPKILATSLNESIKKLNT